MESQKQTKQNKINPIDTENRVMVARGEGGGVGEEMGEGVQKVQTSSYKINKPWGCNVQHGNYS